MIMQQMGHVNPGSLFWYDTPSSEDSTRVSQILHSSSSSNSNNQPLNNQPLNNQPLNSQPCNDQPCNDKRSNSTSTAAPCSVPAQPPNVIDHIQPAPHQLSESDPCSSLKRGPPSDLAISNKKPIITIARIKNWQRYFSI